jgi:hypothetical protein
MASDIAGLFTTPEQYQLAQDQAQQAQALQFAKLDPRAQAQYGFYRGGQLLGSAIGGALGGEDPQLKIISQRQQLAAQLDPSKPASFMQAAELAAKSGDQQFAIALADAGRQAAVQVAQANKERQLAIPADIQKAQMIPQIQDAIDQYSAMPPSPERDRAIRLLNNQMKVLVGDKTATVAAPLQVAARIVEITKQQSTLSPESPEYKLLEAEKTQLQRPEKPEARPSVGSDREAFALTEFDRNYYDLTPEQRIKVNALADAEAAKKAAASAPKVQVDLKDPTAVAKSNLDVMGKWENFVKSGGDVEVANRYKSVKSAVAMANAGNPSADGALLYNIAKMYDPSGAVQEGDKKSITGNPNIPTRFKLLVQGVLEGGSFTPEQRKDVERIADEIVKNRQSQLNVYRKQYVNKIKALDGTEEDILDPYKGLIRPPLSTFTQTPNTNPQNITGGRR